HGRYYNRRSCRSLWDNADGARITELLQRDFLSTPCVSLCLENLAHEPSHLVDSVEAEFAGVRRGVPPLRLVTANGLAHANTCLVRRTSEVAGKFFHMRNGLVSGKVLERYVRIDLQLTTKQLPTIGLYDNTIGQGFNPAPKPLFALLGLSGLSE